ncbi:MAG: HD domain-containing protein [Deltaproteobacteria bacterium]|nr:HD domain-containing protein [Deltaproteobacteria bacterium]
MLHTPTDALRDVFAWLERSSSADYIGEPVSQLEHALQCAHFARKAAASDEVVLGALLHDIGHLVAPAEAPQMDGLGVVAHEEIGARYVLERGFSPTVAELVRGHVQGKRYLTYKNESYGARLSEASRRTLEFQGGAMTGREAAEFERDPLFKEKVQVRKFDEAAKRTDLDVEPLAFYAPLALRHLEHGGRR